ncbi:J domain-containing protein [Massilia sp.]|uniref:J domain-containing protein n=2 Tax=unclassified Massilia TaxID=2609279 RepID=UPI0028AE133F|nr:J domain-containing protein [Massilia sp.]
MAKIHTHYDNLKVARGAPGEVVRAAYKALSQKYHPDKNPGDEKAARIMAIVNTAYNTLSDPVRRKEHDEWIAAEEWEVEWLESSGEEGGRTREGNWEAPPPALPRPSLWRDPKWWLGILGGVTAGAGAVFLLLQPPGVLPSALAFNARPAAAPRTEGTAPTPGLTPAPAPVSEAEPDVWAGLDGARLPASQVKALAVTQLVVPPRQPDCATDLATPGAPNGEPWPADSGYIAGYPVGNQGKEMSVVVDNSANEAPVFVKIHDLDRRSNVRHAYVESHATFTVDGLAAGRYEVRYQNVVTEAAHAACAAAAPLRQAATGL